MFDVRQLRKNRIAKIRRENWVRSSPLVPLINALRQNLQVFLVRHCRRKVVCHDAMISLMQNWEYKVFASHLDPAELVLLLDESGRQGWELVTLVGVIDDLPVEVLGPAAAAPELDSDEQAEVIQMQAFRYIFKRPLVTG